LEESVEFIPIANKPSSIEVVAINDIADKTMAHLINTTVYMEFYHFLQTEKGILVDGKHFYFS
jgi:glyceraldehyde-3-phosphate dehydrogenase/erythrose-4-phosphate dehydrogenase